MADASFYTPLTGPGLIADHVRAPAVHTGNLYLLLPSLAGIIGLYRGGGFQNCVFGLHASTGSVVFHVFEYDIFEARENLGTGRARSEKLRPPGARGDEVSIGENSDPGPLRVQDSEREVERSERELRNIEKMLKIAE